MKGREGLTRQPPIPGQEPSYKMQGGAAGGVGWGGDHKNINR